MAIVKIITDSKGVSTGYHRIHSIQILATQTSVVVRSWVSKERYEADVIMPAAARVIDLPDGIIQGNAFADVQSWLINNADSPLFEGVVDEDADALTKAKVARKRYLRQQQDIYEFGGVGVPGIGVVATDPTSQRLLTGTAVLALIANAKQQVFGVDWTLADGTIVQLELQDIIRASVIVGQHVAQVYAVGRAAQAAIDAAETIEAVNAVTL